MLETLEKVATIVGGFGTLLLSLLATCAGIWWFYKRASLRPKLTVGQEVTALPGPPGKRLLQIVARLENAGEIPVTLNEWRVWAIPLDPLPQQVLKALDEKKGMCVEHELEWPSCGGGERAIGEVRIRPGEVQEVVATMLLSEEIPAVRIYSSFPHVGLNVRRGEDRVWTCYTVARFRDGRERPTSQPIERPAPRIPNQRDEPYRRPVQHPGADEPYRRPIEPPPQPPAKTRE